MRPTYSLNYLIAHECTIFNFLPQKEERDSMNLWNFIYSHDQGVY